MGRLFWGLVAVSMFFFFRAYLESQGYGKVSSQRSDSNMLFNCAKDGVNFDTTFSESLGICRQAMSDLSLSYNQSAETRGLVIIGLLFAGLAVWRMLAINGRKEVAESTVKPAIEKKDAPLPAWYEVDVEEAPTAFLERIHAKYKDDPLYQELMWCNVEAELDLRRETGKKD